MPDKVRHLRVIHRCMMFLHFALIVETIVDASPIGRISFAVAMSYREIKYLNDRAFRPLELVL